MNAKFPTRRRVFLAVVTVSIAAGLTLLAGPAALAVDEDVPLDKVPEKLKAAANAAVPKATWKRATRSKDDGEVSYLFEGSDDARRKVWVDLNPDAVVHEVGLEVAYKKVPAVVATKLEKTMPKFKVTTTYEVLEAGKLARYEFTGKRPADKESIDVYVTLDGKKLTIDDDD